MRDLGSISRRLPSSDGIAMMDAARSWTFLLGMSVLFCAALLTERVSAADWVLSADEINGWFDADLKDGLGNRLQVRPNCRLDELIDGPATFQAMARRLRSVSGKGSYIYLLNWWIDDDVPLVNNDSTSKLTFLLQTAADSGVQIRGMFWKNKSQNISKPENWLAVDFINRLPHSSAILDNRTQKYGSHHQKILIIYDINNNELVAFCGGIDFNRDRLFANGVNGAAQEGGPDHDVHCIIRGVAAWDLLQVFINRWDDHPDHWSFPYSPDDRRGLLGINSPGEAATINHAYKQWIQIGHTFPPPLPGGGAPWGFGTSTWYTFAPHGEQSARGMILHAIANATRYIYFEDQFMVSPEASQALQDALRKNSELQLIILLPDWTITLGGKATQQHRHAFLAPLKRVAPGRVHVFRRQAPDGYHTYIHSKTWIFDDQFAIIGSACCNNRSWTWDSEVVAGVCDPGNGVNQRMPHRLRVELWGEHLNASADQLDDWRAAVALWYNPPFGNHITPYDDSEPWFPIDWPVNQLLGTFWGETDPDGGTLPLH